MKENTIERHADEYRICPKDSAIGTQIKLTFSQQLIPVRLHSGKADGQRLHYWAVPVMPRATRLLNEFARQHGLKIVD